MGGKRRRDFFFFFLRDTFVLGKKTPPPRVLSQMVSGFTGNCNKTHSPPLRTHAQRAIRGPGDTRTTPTHPHKLSREVNFSLVAVLAPPFAIRSPQCIERCIGIGQLGRVGAGSESGERVTVRRRAGPAASKLAVERVRKDLAEDEDEGELRRQPSAFSESKLKTKHYHGGMLLGVCAQLWHGLREGRADEKMS
jgi:hypothetical protein